MVLKIRMILQLFDEFNANARQRGRVLQFQNIQYGYMRIEPRFGVDYVLDMILWFKKFRPPHRFAFEIMQIIAAYTFLITFITGNVKTITK